MAGVLQAVASMRLIGFAHWIAMQTVSTELDNLAPMPDFSQANWPSYLYVALFVLNTVAIVLLADQWLGGVFVLVQGFFMVGMLELTHQAVHRRFVVGSRFNEIFGSVAAGLIGFNLVAYRHFHLEHHRHTCDEADPEGLLYADSPHTRWFWLGAPIAHAVVAWQINRLARRYVPFSKRQAWLQANAVLALILVGLLVWAALSPLTFALAYLLPACLFAWIDFLFSQAEHYGAPIRATDASVNVASVTLDVRLPLLLSHLMLNRNLHRVHHVWPRTRWFEAPAFLALLDTTQPGRVVSCLQFGSRWLAQGPRLWHNPRNSFCEYRHPIDQ